MLRGKRKSPRAGAGEEGVKKTKKAVQQKTSETIVLL
jgi:hypothetical protein